MVLNVVNDHLQTRLAALTHNVYDQERQLAGSQLASAASVRRWYCVAAVRIARHPHGCFTAHA